LTARQVGGSVGAQAAPLIASRTLSDFSNAGLTFQAGPFGAIVGRDDAAALATSATVSVTAKQVARLPLFGCIRKPLLHPRSISQSWAFASAACSILQPARPTVNKCPPAHGRACHTFMPLC
jgi:hypothetical protein